MCNHPNRIEDNAWMQSAHESTVIGCRQCCRRCCRVFKKDALVILIPYGITTVDYPTISYPCISDGALATFHSASHHKAWELLQFWCLFLHLWLSFATHGLEWLSRRPMFRLTLTRDLLCELLLILFHPEATLSATGLELLVQSSSQAWAHVCTTSADARIQWLYLRTQVYSMPMGWHSYLRTLHVHGHLCKHVAIEIESAVNHLLLHTKVS